MTQITLQWSWNLGDAGGYLLRSSAVIFLLWLADALTLKHEHCGKLLGSIGNAALPFGENAAYINIRRDQADMAMA